MLDRVLAALIAGLKEPLELLIDPNKRVYWPLLLVSLALGLFVLWRRGRSWRRAVRELVSRDVWLHRSALMDYRLVPVKMFLHTLLLAPLVLSAWGLAIAVASWLDASFGSAGATSLSRLEITVLYTVVLFIAWDASRYLVHRLLHTVPSLWEFHKVHHSAEVLTPFTVHRVHPVESLLFGVRGAAVTGVVTGVFFYLFAGEAVQYELLGVNALGLGFNALASNLRHSHVWLSFGARVERLLLSPAQHQLHHSRDARDYNCNYGSYIALWDRLGGTLRLAGKQRALRFGLDDADRNHDPGSVGSAIVGPLVSFARSAPSWLPNAAMAALVIAVACSDDAPASPDAHVIELDRRALLVNVGENIILPAVEQFDGDATVLATSVSDYCAALGTAGEDDARAAAQASWLDANATWQRAEVMQLGPVKDNSSALHDVIYSWPIVSPCAVDREVVALRGDPSYDITTKLTNRRGLDALEYLLFTPTLDAACIVDGWDALADADKRAARCDYALLAANDLATSAATLADAWRPAAGNFLGNLTSAGEAGSSYPSLDDAVNDVFGALFYLDSKTKDMKLAEVVGLRTNVCGTTNAACPEERESQFANVSKQNIAANLEAFDIMFHGDTGLGFDDYLIAAGGDTLASAVTAATTEARAATDELQSSLADELSSNYAGVVALHGKVKAITDLLKNDIPTLTGLRVPPESGGDTD